MIQTPRDSDFMPYDGFHNCPPVPHDHLMVSPPIGIGPRGEKGEQGEQGPKGDTGEFNVPTASVDNEIGEPYVEVTSTGEGEEKVFDFAFHNLKGDQGEPLRFEDLTTEQLDELRSDVASVYYRKDDDSYVTVGTNTTTIAIPFADYLSTDMLFVDVEGPRLR